MQRTTLGRTGIEVSEYCLGTMTWGTQTPEPDAHAQIERAYEAGIDFMDTAEMYPVNPVRAETVGVTETIIGNWIARTGRRKDWIIATKHSGANGGFVRDGRGIHPDTVRDAVDGSLRRLQTDYIDLYQFHWPNRGSYHFRQNWDFDPSKQPPKAEIVDEMNGVMQVLKALVDEGKIRAFGLSNDSAWGTMRWLEAEWLVAIPRGVELAAIGQPAGIVHRNALAGTGRLALATGQVFVFQSRVGDFFAHRGFLSATEKGRIT